MRNYQMRNRMIQLGYTAAKGVLNFVDDGYIEPFAFSADTCRGSRTFVISPKETLEEYVRNPGFPGTAGHGALRLCRRAYLRQ